MLIIGTYISMLVFLISFCGQKNTILNNKYSQTFFVIVFVIISTSIVYFSDLDFVDRIRYNVHFEHAKGLSLTAYLSEYDGDYLFYILTWCISNMIDNVLFYYVILHLFFLRNLIKGLKMINGYLLVTIFLFIFIKYSFY